MKYGNYKKKVLIVNKILNFLFKIRFIILSIIVVSLTAFISINSITGTSATFTTKIEEVHYGEDYDFFSKATLNNGYVEYKNKRDDKWSDIKPKRAGEYLARCYSFNGWNNKVYGETVEFKILPKNLAVNYVYKTIIYGKKLEFNYSGLEYSDHVENIVYDFGENYFKVNPFLENKTFECNVLFNEEKFKVVDLNGNDVTSNYVVSYPSENILIQKRPLSILGDDKTKTYDGEELSSTDYKFINNTSLAEGDEIEIVENATITDLGTISNNIDFKIKDSKGFDRTAYYDITSDLGELSVTERQISIQTNSIEKVYDGLPLKESDFSYEITGDSILDNHLLSIEFENIGVINANSCTNSISYTIIDKDSGADASKYYDISFDFGSINISKKTITVSSYSEEKIYDGIELKGDFIYEGLADSDEIIFNTNAPSIIEPGDVTYSPNFDIVNKDSKESVIDNYLVESIEGTLTIKIRNINVFTNTIEKTYDGVTLTRDDVSYDITGDGLLDNHHVEAIFSMESENMLGGYTNYRNSFASFNILDEENNDVSKYYNISNFYFGTVTILNRELTIKNSTTHYEYDNLYHSNDDFTSEGLAEGDTIVIDDSALVSIKEVGNKKNKLTYEIKNLNGEDVTKYYNITEDFNDIVVDKKVIYIESNNYVATYSGKELSESEINYQIKNEDYPSLNEKYLFDIRMDLVNKNISSFIGQDTPNTFKTIIYDRVTGEDITDNFDVQETIGTVHISKAPLNIKTNDAEFDYNGTYNEELGNTITGKQGDDYITMTKHTKSINKINTKNVQQFKIYKDSSSSTADYEVTNCYDINYEYGSFVVNGRDISLDLSECGFNKVYERVSSTFRFENYKITSGSLFSGDEISFSLKSGKIGSFSVPGTYNLLDYYDIKVMHGNIDVTESYNFLDIIGCDGIITKRPVSIRFDGENKTYDGLSASITHQFDGLLDGDDLTYTTIKDKKSYYKVTDGENFLKQYSIIDKTNNNKDVTAYYEPTVVENPIIIVKRDLLLKFPNFEKDYDGNADFSSQPIQVISPSQLGNYDTVSDFSLTVNDENSCSETAYDYDLSDVVITNSYYRENSTKNYNISFFGTPTYKINPISISIYLDESSYNFVYDGNEYSFTKNLRYSGVLINNDKISVVNYDDFIAKYVSDSGNKVNEVLLDNIEILKENGENNTRNYSINIESDYTYNILQRDLTIVSSTCKKPYNNLPVESSLRDKYQIASGTLAITDSLQVTFNEVNDVDAGNYENSFDVKIVDKSTLDDVTSNYNVVKVYGDMTIEPIRISITQNNISQKYDGKTYDLNIENNRYALTNQTTYFTINKATFDLLKAIEGLEWYIEFKEEVKGIFNVGTYSYDFSLLLLLNGVDVTSSSNFVLDSTTEGIFNIDITKLNLIISFIGGESPYFEDLYFPEIFTLSGDVYNMQKIGDVLYFGNEKRDKNKDNYEGLEDMIEPGVYDEEYFADFFASIRILNKKGEDVTNCYSININFKKVIIEE